MQPEIKETIEKTMDLILAQIKSYKPFIRVAFPSVKDLSDLCYNLMVGNALTAFLGQCAMRMQTPSKDDFAEFGVIVEKYREKVKEIFG